MNVEHQLWWANRKVMRENRNGVLALVQRERSHQPWVRKKCLGRCHCRPPDQFTEPSIVVRMPDSFSKNKIWLIFVAWEKVSFVLESVEWSVLNEWMSQPIEGRVSSNGVCLLIYISTSSSLGEIPVRSNHWINREAIRSLNFSDTHSPCNSLRSWHCQYA